MSYLFMLVFVATVVKRDLFNEIVSVISNALDKNMSGLGHSLPQILADGGGAMLRNVEYGVLP